MCVFYSGVSIKLKEGERALCWSRICLGYKLSQAEWHNRNEEMFKLLWEEELSVP